MYMKEIFNASMLPVEAQRFIQENNLDYYFKYQLSEFVEGDNVGKNIRTSSRVANRKLTPDELTQFKQNIYETCLGGIGEEYFYNIVDNVINNIYNPKYDIVILCVKPNEVNASNKSNKQKETLYDRISGFLITEIGECNLPKYKNIPALNLICSNSKKNRMTGKLLMYMYLQALKRRNIPYGILELAGNYSNLPGFCLYNGFGFREDLSIKSGDEEDESKQPRCFPEKDTLTMICNLSKVSEQDILNVVKLQKKIYYENEDRSVPADPLCVRNPNPKDRKKERENKTYLNARINNFFKLVDYQLETPIESIKSSNPEYNAPEFNTKEKIIKHMMNKSKTGETIFIASNTNSNNNINNKNNEPNNKTNNKSNNKSNNNCQGSMCAIMGGKSRKLHKTKTPKQLKSKQSKTKKNRNKN